MRLFGFQVTVLMELTVLAVLAVLEVSVPEVAAPEVAVQGLQMLSRRRCSCW
jgi:hypothetical protein